MLGARMTRVLCDGNEGLLGYSFDLISGSLVDNIGGKPRKNRSYSRALRQDRVLRCFQPIREPG